MILSKYWCWWSLFSTLLFLCIPLVVYSSNIICIDHQRKQRRQLDQPSLNQQNIRHCNKAPFARRKRSTPPIANKIYYTLHCDDTNAVCEHVNHSVRRATDILSNMLQLETPLYANISYFSFCDVYQECTIDKNEISIGQTSPSVSYLMTDQTDNMTRMYPQAILKQFTRLEPKPSWIEYDIISQFNGDNYWYYTDDTVDILPSQTDLLRTILHELVHGLGFVSSWDDNLYSRFAPYVDNLTPFLTPMFLMPPKQLDSIVDNQNTDKGNQPFWGFVEYPLDKYMMYHSVPMTTITKLLNHWGDGNVLYNSIYDMVNAWINSDLHLYAESAYQGSTTSRDIAIDLPNNNNTILMETSLVPFADGSTLSHVDYSTYHNTADYLMTYTSKPGVTVAAMNQYYSTGPLGPDLLDVLASLGYRIKQSSYQPVRPHLTFWNPPDDLVGTTDNPTASASVVPNGPARTPSAPLASSKSTASTLAAYYYYQLFLFHLLVVSTILVFF
ncbi:hypothetical protein BC941DRAFT_432151 [Chlamydoabsidia padenii]|nr:hypothetical protein BC941DRAFT_432151 [Chlamydoabsidia padenii]